MLSAPVTCVSIPTRTSNLHDLRLFAAQNLVQLFDVLGGVILHLGFRTAKIIVSDVLFLMHLLEHLVGITSMVAHRDTKILRYLADMADQFLAPLLGQLRNRTANHLAIVNRRKAELRGLLDG